jgi:hypothetical protein
MFHTHTLPKQGGTTKVRTGEMEMRMKGDEGEVKVKMK